MVRPATLFVKGRRKARITSWGHPWRKLFSWAGGSLPGVESVGLRPPAFPVKSRDPGVAVAERRRKALLCSHAGGRSGMS
jgi:hypothetical protein